MSSKGIDSIDEIIKDLKSKVEEYYKSNSKPVMGWYCTYVPEEIFYAAGFLPYRIMGDGNIVLGKSKACLHGNLNPFTQSCLECALNGKYDFLSGIVIGNSDDATRRLFDAWRKYVSTPFIYLLDIPKKTDEQAIRRYSTELSFLKDAIEDHFRVKIQEKSLKEAILIYNETRSLLQNFSDLRKTNKYLITSNQFLEIAKLSVRLDKKFFNEQIKLILRTLNTITDNSPLVDKPRILITGSYQDQPWFAESIEEAGGVVVCEDLCTRLRYFQDLVSVETQDYFYALSKRYLNKPPCARMVDFNKRFNYLQSLIKDFKIDAVIYYALKFDDPYLFEFPELLNKLQKENIPVLFIESEHRIGAKGQLKTRIQAFLETLTFKVPI